MVGREIWLVALAASIALAQSTTILTGSQTVSVTGDDVLPTGSQVTYLSYSSTLTLSSTFATPSNGTNSTISGPETSSPVTLTYLGGSTNTANATATTSSTRPTNTQPCNGHPEFCTRKYSNITMITAHNFPFARKGNAASNQVFGVIDQLNDGVRMLQGQTHYVNNTMYYCHTSCDILNVGTVESYFTQIRQWVDTHPYDVVTILIGNSDYDTVWVDKYVAPIENSGLKRYAYIPPKIPMALDDWPTLSEMILRQERVVIFIDYNANQTQVPYVLDEFSQMFETPFSPTDPAFPCTQQRPPGISTDQAKQRLYMANHNLNTPVDFLGANLLVPNVARINETNADTGNVSLGLMANNCLADWGRSPNFLLVDFYNYGNFPGSVFQVAADHNNVTYNRKCCGLSQSASGRIVAAKAHVAVIALAIGFTLLL